MALHALYTLKLPKWLLICPCDLAADLAKPESDVLSLHPRQCGLLSLCVIIPLVLRVVYSARGTKDPVPTPRAVGRGCSSSRPGRGSWSWGGIRVHRKITLQVPFCIGGHHKFVLGTTVRHPFAPGVDGSARLVQGHASVTPLLRAIGVVPSL